MGRGIFQIYWGIGGSEDGWVKRIERGVDGVISEMLREATAHIKAEIEGWYFERLSEIVPTEYLSKPEKYVDEINQIVRKSGYVLEIENSYSWDDLVVRTQYDWRKRK